MNSFEGQVCLAHVPLPHTKEILANTLQIGLQALLSNVLLTALCDPHLQVCLCLYVVLDTVGLFQKMLARF